MAHLYKFQSQLVVLSKWEWVLKWEVVYREEDLEVQLEPPAAQVVEVDMVGVPCPWAAEAILAEAILI